MGMQIARQYPDKQVSTSSLDSIALGVTIGLLVVLGLMLTFFIPALPAPNPRRGFDFFSWFVAIQTEKIVAAGSKTVLRPGLDLDDDEVVQSLGELKVRSVEEQDLMDF
ncbi:hypothetical protein DFP72DRAFT_288715 [Ephemerocybe angulata]|uniref:Uncharacterized protein n=1 Tax=Ephemerocybe angulata TaxID=980116 RepID=A0A8H6H7I3_9AGAR|nr:hypothetical protein DFP72DRAFT_288715 [Tulosesus angulatus]